MIYTAFFGDGEKTFALTPQMIAELERKTDHGIFALFTRLRTQNASFKDITETIRCALIGGGTEPREAAELVFTYAEQRPLGEGLGLALTILSTRFFGPDNNTLDEKRQSVPADKLRADIARAFESGEAK